MGAQPEVTTVGSVALGAAAKGDWEGGRLSLSVECHPVCTVMPGAEHVLCVVLAPHRHLCASRGLSWGWGGALPLCLGGESGASGT